MSDSDPSKQEQNDESTIPEVEAEIVETDQPSQESGSLFEDGDDNVAPHDAEQAAGAPARSKGRPTGAIALAVFAVIALSAGGYWFFTQRGEPAKEADKTVSEPEVSAAEGAKTEAVEKITNAAPGDAKTAALNGPSQEGPEVDLPALTPKIENSDLTSDAKAVLGGTPENEESAPLDEDMSTAPASPSIELALEDSGDEGAPLAGDDAIRPTTDEVVADAENDEIALVESDAPIPENDEMLEAGTTFTHDLAVNSAPETASEIETQPLENEDSPAVAAPTAGIDADRLAMLEADLTEAQSRAAALENELAALTKQAETAARALADAREQLAAANAEIADLHSRNNELAEAAQNSPLADGAVALNALTRSVDKGRPFSDALSTLSQLAPNSGAIAALTPFAEGGAPTTGLIKQEFEQALREGLSAARLAEAKGAGARYGARLANVVNIRPAGPQEGSTPEAIFSRAENAVENDDLAVALNEIETLPQPAQEAMKDWIEKARKRLAIETALNELAEMIAREANG